MYPQVPFPVLCDWIFVQPDQNVDSWTCTLCDTEGIRKSNSPGNLIKHCASLKKCVVGFTYRGSTHPRCHQDLQPLFKLYAEWKAERTRSNQLGFAHEVSPFAKQLRAWIDIVVKCNMPLNVCENEIMRSHVNVKGMSRKTLRKYIIKLADVVGLVIQEKIGPGCCIADAWSCAGIHYLAIYHQWPYLQSNDRIVVKTALLSCAPYVNETSFDANSQARTIKATYDMYGSADLIVCVTLDNTNTNPATARILKVPMVGAMCHRLNLASRCWLKEAFDGELIDNLDTIHAIMKRASTLKSRGRLKEFTPLVPQVQNKTRWTGYHEMAIKYSKMHEYLEKTGDYDSNNQDNLEEIEVQDVEGDNDIFDETPVKKVAPNLLTGSTLAKFKDEMLPALKALRKWFIAIQHNELTLQKGREAFDHICKSPLLKGESTAFEERLQRDHKLVTFPHFENGVEKIALGKSEELSPDEKTACRCLLKSRWPHLYKEATNSSSDETDSAPSSPTKFLKTLSSERRPSGVMRSQYISNVDWISPTSVKAERLFSKNRHVLSFNRRRLLPRAFEAIVYLKENIEYWDISLIQQMVAGKFDERLKEDYNTDSDEDEFDEET
mgnify:CR=1 FL=1